VNPFKRLLLAIARTKLSSTKLEGGTGRELEEWIAAKVAAEARKSPELRAAIGRPRPEEVDRAMLREYQLFRFRRQMVYTGENSAYYRKLWRESGVKPRDIVTFDDLTKVPLTDPKDLAAEPLSFLCVSQGKVMRAFSTSGTSGTRKRLFYTQHDILSVIDPIAAALKNVGMTRDDTLQIMFPAVAAWDPGLMLEGACKVAGLGAVIASMVDVDEQMRTVREHRSTMMIGLTSFIYRITVLAREKYDLRSLGIKAIILSAEPLSEAMRREVESSWGCKALTQYGLTEMGLATTIECNAQEGLHVDDADYLVEVIDPETGEHVKERQEGELVWSSLSFEGSPLLRYRSYDLGGFIEPPCPCGFKAVGKIAKPRGRLDVVTKIGFGQKVYPLLFDEAVLSVHGVVSYQMHIEKAGYRDRLRCVVEFAGDMDPAKQEIAARLAQVDEIRSALESDLVELAVEMRPPDQAGYVPKAKVIVDHREQYD
jgi:phenylacetate-CoA ligase